MSILPALAQEWSGDVRPLNTEPPSAAAVEFFAFDFQSLAFGREGPDYFGIKTAPVAGREYLIDANVSSVDAIASLRFDLTDEAGRTIRPLIMWKSNDSATDGEFHGPLTVPSHPFGVSVTGTDRRGRRFHRRYPHIIQPAGAGPEPLLMPPGLKPEHVVAVRKMIDGHRREIEARRDQAARRHPGGLITLTRSGVLDMRYEPFRLASGDPIGLRLQYRILFNADSSVTTVPHVFPAYSAPDWRGVVTMKPLQGDVKPDPELPGATSLTDVIVYSADARYRAGVTYSFTVDLVPDYVIQGVRTGRFCLYEKRFEPRRARREAIRSDATPVRYSISISDLDYAAEIPAFLPQRTFHESFTRAGAGDCGPMPSNRF